jgi:autotransporter-associated beta strand protein
MKPQTHPPYTYCLLFCLQAVSQAAEIPKLFNNTSLNLGGSWDGGVVPGAADVMLWNNIHTDTWAGAGNLPQLGSDAPVQGIRVTNVGGTLNQGARLVGFQNGSSANTLILGSGGIDMSVATQAFLIQSKVTLGASQSWNVANANTANSPAGFNGGEDLSLHAQVLGAPFNLGGHTLTGSGAGTVLLTSGYALSNGTLVHNGPGTFVIQSGNFRNTTLDSTLALQVTSGTLRLLSNSGSTTNAPSLVSSAPATVGGTGILLLTSGNPSFGVSQSGPVTLNTGGTLNQELASTGINLISGGVNVAGTSTWTISNSGAPALGAQFTGNLTGSANLAFNGNNSASPGVFQGDNSGYSGTITLGGTALNVLRLGSTTAGSAAATWNIGPGKTLEVDGVSVQLGKLQGSGTIMNSHATLPATLNVESGQFPGSIIDGVQPVALNKTGPDTLFLGGFNNYTGATTVTGGTLLATSDQIGGTDVTVADGATYGVRVVNPDTTLFTGDLTVGTATGGTLLFDYGSNPNPFTEALTVNNLRFNGPSTVKIVGKNLSPGTFPLAQFTTLDPLSTPVNALNLALPTRTIGALAAAGSDINLTITSTEQVKWNGEVSNDWDIDPDGSGGSGTPNWKTTVTDASTRYIQGSGGSDVVNFDDTATGTGSVNLTASLSPVSVTVNNSTLDYTFTGSGKLTGSTGLEKTGTGTLTLANTAVNDFTGGTVIGEGTLRLGDGVTPGAGVIAGSIENFGTLVINRPDDHDFALTLSGSGVLEKAQASTLNFPAATVLDSSLAITGGKLRFANGGTLTGAISGSGELEAAGGTLFLGGADANTHGGLTTVSAGVLQLNKPADTPAVGGNIDITGSGVLVTSNSEQIPDGATVRVLGSSADAINNAGMETFANGEVNGTAANSQLTMRNGMTISGTATVTHGVLGVASGQTGTANAIVMNSPTAIVRVAGNSGPSILNVGAGGITASAGDLQVKFLNNDMDATLNLSGDVTTTGNFTISNGNYAGAFLNVIRLNGTRTFDIGGGTTTTVNPDLGDYVDIDTTVFPGTLVKSGDGTLVLNPLSSAAHTGGTTVTGGTLQVNGALAGTVQVGAAGTLGGTGILSGAATIQGTIAPGTSSGNLTSTSSLTLAPDSSYDVEIANWAGSTAGTDWDHLAVDSLVLTATPENKLTLRILGTPLGFNETSKTLVIASSTQAVTGFNPAAIDIDATGFSGAGTWAVQLNGNNLELAYTGTGASPYDAWATDENLDETNKGPSLDPDNDGQTNLAEFALNSTALSGASSGKVLGKIATVGAEQALTLTLPVREGAVFAGTTELTAAVDGVLYRIQASDGLGTWNLAVSEVTGGDATAIQAGLPTLPSGWTYRSFRSPGPVVGDPKEFIRVKIEPTA